MTICTSAFFYWLKKMVVACQHTLDTSQDGWHLCKDLSLTKSEEQCAVHYGMLSVAILPYLMVTSDVTVMSL